MAALSRTCMPMLAPARPLKLQQYARKTSFTTRRVVFVRSEDSKVTREFDEGKGEVSTPGAGSSEEGKPLKQTMSPEYQKRLRDEYTSFGGSPDKPLPANYFGIIILVIAFLAVLTKALGYI